MTQTGAPGVRAGLILAGVLWTAVAPIDAQVKVSRPSASSGQQRPATEAQPSADEPVADSPSSTLLRAFGAVGWTGTDKPGTPNAFALGQFAIFATSTLGERVSVLAEMVLEASQHTRVVTDLERLQLTYRFDDRLRLSAGRYHTGIGYYNSAFHHGSYFEVPVGRPRIFGFEDEGGVLPVHDVGVFADGVFAATMGDFTYKAEIGDGRAWTHEIQDIDSDPETNDAKATNVGVGYRSKRLTGLEAGVSWYRDTIAVHDGPSIDHDILAAYVIYKTASTEVLAEWLGLRHEPAGGPAFQNGGGYVQVSRAWGILRPYYRYDRLTIDPATPLIGAAGRYRSNVVGLRVDPGPWFGIKAQYERTEEHGLRGIDTVRTQLVFVF